MALCVTTLNKDATSKNIITIVHVPYTIFSKCSPMRLPFSQLNRYSRSRKSLLQIAYKKFLRALQGVPKHERVVCPQTGI